MPRVDNRGNLRGSASQNGQGGARSIKGAEDFLALSKKLKAAGESGLRKELHKAVRDAAKPLPKLVKQAAREKGPKRGKLNQRLARKSYRVQARTGEKTAGVRVVGSKVDPRINDEGRIYHPIFGRTGKPKNGGTNTAIQTVPAVKGYFDETIRAEAREIRRAVVQAIEDFAKKIPN